MPGAILCSGNLTQDILVSSVSNITFETTTWVDAIELSPGGNGASTSYTMAVLGTPVRLLGAAGRDEFGDRILARLAAAGVDIAGIARLDLPTPTTVVLVRPGGSRAFLHRPGASRDALPDPIDFTAERIHGCSHYHLANPFAIPGVRKHAAENLRRARAAGLTTSLDTGWDSRGEWMQVIGPCLPHIDLLFANEQESDALTGSSDPLTAAGIFRAGGAQSVVIKLAARGCLVFDDDARIVQCPGYAVQAVDSTGAGDCFVGAFLTGLHRRMTVENTAQLANAVGAMTVEKLGGTAGVVPFEVVTEWMSAPRP